jgi:tRNA threonylcarbamoyladenosine biosynthesis protein TsaB
VTGTPSAGPGRSPFGGLILAMDTAAREGSAALAAPLGGEKHQLEVLARVTLRKEEEHASLLIPRINGLMEEIGADREEISGVVVGAGPGSFTGVRVGAATAKGFARALNLPLWAFSSLAAAAVEDGSTRGLGGHSAWSLSDSDGVLTSDFETLRPRGVLFDARGDRVYAGAYVLGERGLDTILPPQAATLSEILDGIFPEGVLLMGDGAVRHRVLLEGHGFSVLPPPFGQPTADGLIRLLALNPETPPLEDPGRWEPEYLRASGAERMWKTKAEQGA